MSSEFTADPFISGGVWSSQSAAPLYTPPISEPRASRVRVGQWKKPSSQVPANLVVFSFCTQGRQHRVTRSEHKAGRALQARDSHTILCAQTLHSTVRYVHSVTSTGLVSTPIRSCQQAQWNQLQSWTSSTTANTVPGPGIHPLLLQFREPATFRPRLCPPVRS